MVNVTLVYKDSKGYEEVKFVALEKMPVVGDTINLNENKDYVVKEVKKHSLDPSKHSKATILIERN